MRNTIINLFNKFIDRINLGQIQIVIRNGIKHICIVFLNDCLFQFFIFLIHFLLLFCYGEINFIVAVRLKRNFCPLNFICSDCFQSFIYFRGNLVQQLSLELILISFINLFQMHENS